MRQDSLGLMKAHCPQVLGMQELPEQDKAYKIYGNAATYSDACIRSWYIYYYATTVFNEVDPASKWPEWVIGKDQITRTKLASFFDKEYLKDAYQWPSPGHNYQDAIAQDLLRGQPAVLPEGEEPGNLEGCAASETGVQQCTIAGGGMHSFRIGLHQNYTLSPDYCQARDSYAVPVGRGIYKCSPYVWFQPVYCQGVHDCKVFLAPEAIEAGLWMYVSDKIVAEYTQRRGEGMAYTEAVDLGVYLLANEMLANNGGKPYLSMPVQSLPLFDHEAAAWNKLNPFAQYDAGVNLQYDDILPPLMGGTGMRCTGTYSNVLDYSQCDFDDNYQKFVQSVYNNLLENENLVLPAQQRVLSLATKRLLMSPGIPAWSQHHRDPRQTFLQSLTNATYQCSKAARSVSICSEHTDALSGNRSLYVLNPWLGGAFNVLERDGVDPGGGCDTNLLDILDTDGGGFNPEYIDPNCDAGVPACAPGNLLTATTSKVCIDRRNRAPTYRVMPPFTHDHNLCTLQPPRVPNDCTHPQGMLQNLQGAAHSDLYAEKILQASQVPSALGMYRTPFYMGGDATPAAAAVSAEAYGYVAVQPDELAGHHVVYAVVPPGKLVIQNTPIRSYASYVELAGSGACKSSWRVLWRAKTAGSCCLGAALQPTSPCLTACGAAAAAAAWSTAKGTGLVLCGIWSCGQAEMRRSSP